MMKATRRKFLGLMGLAATAPVAAKVAPFISFQPRAIVSTVNIETVATDLVAALARSMRETQEIAAMNVLNNAFSLRIDDASNE